MFGHQILEAEAVKVAKVDKVDTGVPLSWNIWMAMENRIQISLAAPTMTVDHEPTTSARVTRSN